MSRRAQLTVLLLVLGLAVAVAGAVYWWAFSTKGYTQRITLPEATQGYVLPTVRGDSRLPLVVIDAGHGGHDPGAAGQGLVEKNLVLKLALALRDQLEKDGDVRVALTRDDDRYLLHSERFEIARRLDASLFVSIHADSAGDASDVAGASIYTLSNEASSEAAARFAERENASDRVNGVELGDQSDTVSNILVELSQRRTQEQSGELSRLILREGREVGLGFHPQPQRSAALKVLRAPDVPSVLFESGFITNKDEAARLSSPEGQRRFAETMARAIRIYFARQKES
ncbi:N-acetylmuramoyl-L-alanine amidase family protein [Qipengyuania soli]|uniref:N-acetylmuramoyl-L-alanine amidase n=1 Tax=Qipengyuania soli TaxID=2782568 RepID=A0A7S8F6M9_9SPHN|nr:N-acetylmuramoyl-L-alanine amidase [Qipengyuania soli]QPD00119.1 N-acetylmuramoyl-L-alanine amidase [Qipengyuania soli]